MYIMSILSRIINFASTPEKMWSSDEHGKVPFFIKYMYVHIGHVTPRTVFTYIDTMKKEPCKYTLNINRRSYDVNN